jgi:hypothetical protein
MNLSKTDITKEILVECFSTDSELLSTYHIASGNTAEFCANKTFEDLKTALPSFQFFRVENDNNLIGFFGSEDKYLTTIFVKPEYRNKKDLNEFWGLILNHFNGPFNTCIYEKNSRCAKFYERNGGMLKATPIVNGENTLFYYFNGSNLCR